MFTVGQRDALRERVLRLAADDDRVVAGAVVGSLAVDGGGDRFSDLDLTFAVADEVAVTAVLADWTSTLIDELDAIRLADLESGPTSYRVFLLPGALQLDVSMTPAAQFRLAGPRFRLVFGDTAPDEAAASPPPGRLFIPTPAVAADLFGWGVIYALHARACIERRRVWQAEHYVGAVRDHALSLACLRQGLAAVQARGYDDLPAETLARFPDTHVAAVDADAFRAALAASVSALLRDGEDADLVGAKVVAERLAELTEPLADVSGGIWFSCYFRLLAQVDVAAEQTAPIHAARSPECRRQPAVETVSDCTRTRDRLDHNTARGRAVEFSLARGWMTVPGQHRPGADNRTG